ncbi:MAG: class I SAM-dependent methyltransferase [Candidatus Pacebacteria bacterium]|nr:class I SAM-dependent methyltransferase [Candidatus Paceibacterota bacterium]
MSILNKIIENSPEINTGFKKHYLTLYSIVNGMDAKRVLEIGGGLSTAVILEALKNTGGDLITCDPREIKDLGLDENIQVENKNWNYMKDYSGNVLDKMIGTFDVVLHDGSHEGKTLFKDLRKILPMIKKGGILMVHDTNHPKLKNILLATRLALLGYRTEKMTLPYGNGLTIVVKK